MDSYYKLRQLFYYKVRHGLLQVATGITKCDDYYKLQQYIQTLLVMWYSAYSLQSLSKIYVPNYWPREFWSPSAQVYRIWQIRNSFKSLGEAGSRVGGITGKF